jgi:hypothetical protein
LGVEPGEVGGDEFALAEEVGEAGVAGFGGIGHGSGGVGVF